jgi:hypothetical protein
MRVAWFRPSPDIPISRLDDVASLIVALQARIEVEVVTEAHVDDFEQAHLSRPFDLCVYEVDDSQSHQFIWSYLWRFPGVLLLGGSSLHNSRADYLERAQQYEQYIQEFRFNHGRAPHASTEHVRRLPRGDWPMLRAPLIGSRLVAVRDAALAAALQDEYHDGRVRHLPIGVAPDPLEAAPTSEPPSAGTVTFGAIGDTRTDVIRRAFQRARDTGTRAALALAGAADPALPACDVLLALACPRPEHAVVPALAGMAVGKPVVVLETAITADWPVLNPQTWQPRGLGSGAAPIAVSIDVLDQEHSLMVAMRRLAADAELRAQLATAAQTWWRIHATLDRAVDAWLLTLEEAMTVAPLPYPTNWPRHLRWN